METSIIRIGRFLIGGLFAYAGFGKILAFEGTAGWIASVGLPFASLILILTILLEIIAGIMLIGGIYVKPAAYILAGFTLLATLIFHLDLSDMNQQLFFSKNLMIIGGLLILGATTKNKVEF